MGVMGNVQCPLLQLPGTHHLLRRAWHADPLARGQADLDGLARSLLPGSAAAISRGFAALNATEPRMLRESESAIAAIASGGRREPPGLLGRILFPDATQVVADLARQLAVRHAEALLADALAGGDIGAITAACTGYFRQCLAWEERHGYFAVMRVGRLESLFPRPPIPRESIRTWPPFLPYATELRAVLAAAGDPEGERFFAGIERELSAIFEPEKVTRGVIQAMKRMMGRPEAAQGAV
jgi:hypothetical protein